ESNYRSSCHADSRRQFPHDAARRKGRRDSSHQCFIPGFGAISLSCFRTHSREPISKHRFELSATEKGRWAMKKFLIAVAFLMSVPAWGQDKINPPVPQAGNVTLPLEEYNRLLELANKTPRRVEAAPLPYTIKRGDLKL